MNPYLKFSYFTNYSFFIFLIIIQIPRSQQLKDKVINEDIEDEKAEEVNELLLAREASLLDESITQRHCLPVITVSLSKKLVVLP